MYHAINPGKLYLPTKGKINFLVGDQKTRKEGDENGRSEIKGERQILSCSWLANKSLISNKSEDYENLILTVQNRKGSLKTCS